AARSRRPSTSVRKRHSLKLKLIWPAGVSTWGTRWTSIFMLVTERRTSSASTASRRPAATIAAFAAGPEKRRQRGLVAGLFAGDRVDNGPFLEIEARPLPVLLQHQFPGLPFH